MAKPITSSFKRFGRAVLVLGGAYLVAHFKNNLAYLGLAPLLNALGKYLRAKWNLKNVPF